MTPGVGGDACWAEDRGEEIQTNPKIAKAEMDRSFGIQDQPDKLLHAPNGVNDGGDAKQSCLPIPLLKSLRKNQRLRAAFRVSITSRFKLPVHIRDATS